MQLPNILIVAIGRINQADNNNNGLLLRNVFAGWPLSATAQLYSSGDNSDDGFFGSYYKLTSEERRFGSTFANIKEATSQDRQAISRAQESTKPRTYRGSIINSGLHELIFRPVLSKRLCSWISDFKPQCIFAQGYNLTFTWLPLLIAERFNLPIIYYPTDDWPSDLYSSSSWKFSPYTKFIRKIVDYSSRRLVCSSSILIAFNDFMREEYKQRYSREFAVLMHGDYPERFRLQVSDKSQSRKEYSIVCTGVFDIHRKPLLTDLDIACQILSSRGLMTRAKVLSVNEVSNMDFSHSLECTELLPCPGHNELVAALQDADILFLPERFDATAKDIRLCISSKAHLFMLSGVPAVVYSAGVTGVARYAKSEEWALLVNERNPVRLADAFEILLTSQDTRCHILQRASAVAQKNHNLPAIQQQFMDLATSVVA